MSNSKLAKIYLPSANDVSFNSDDSDFVALNSVNGALINLDQRLDRFENLINVKNTNVYAYVGPNCPENAPAADENGKHPTIFGSYFGDGSSSNPYSLSTQAMDKLGTYRFTGSARPCVRFYPGTYDEYGYWKQWEKSVSDPSKEVPCKIVKWTLVAGSRPSSGVYSAAPVVLYSKESDIISVSNEDTVGLKLYAETGMINVVGFIYSMTGTSSSPGTINLGIYKTNANGETVFENTGVQYAYTEITDPSATGFIKQKILRLDHIDCSSRTRYIEWIAMKYTKNSNGTYSFNQMPSYPRSELRPVKMLVRYKHYSSGGICIFLTYSNWKIVGIDFEEIAEPDPYFGRGTSGVLIGSYSYTAQVSLLNSSFKNTYGTSRFYGGDVSGGAYASIIGCVFDNSERQQRMGIGSILNIHDGNGSILFDNCEFIGDIVDEAPYCSGLVTGARCQFNSVNGSQNIPAGNGKVIVRPLKTIIRFKNLNKCLSSDPSNENKYDQPASLDQNRSYLAFITGGGDQSSKTIYRKKSDNNEFSDIDIAAGVTPVVRQILIGEDPDNPTDEVWVPVNDTSMRRTLGTPYTFGSDATKQTETDFDVTDENFKFGVWIIFEHDYPTIKRSWITE